jgi:hypothetical protein
MNAPRQLQKMRAAAAMRIAEIFAHREQRRYEVCDALLKHFLCDETKSARTSPKNNTSDVAL